MLIITYALGHSRAFTIQADSFSWLSGGKGTSDMNDQSIVYLDDWCNPVQPSVLANVGSMLEKGMLDSTLTGKLQTLL